VLDPTPWATFTVVSRPNDESGLLGLALDAGFPANGFAYVYFTYAAANGRLQNRLVRLREQDGKGVVDKILLDGLAGGDIHDGGRDRIDPGVNYGWPIVFGIRGDPRFRDPLLESGTDTWAPSGATFITTGALAGSLLFAALRGTSLDRAVFADDGRTVLFQERLLAGQ